ncbi:hypothetical protein AB4Y63_17255 [Leifsonia sp. YAF41]|uniref:hypothetical protein n=1 Tax=Leifsonia sp. YAF41 TaxID=3233086 RepID=UPI003F997586
MMFARRILAAILVAAPTAVAGIVVAQWTPLPNPLNVQWSGTKVTNTEPLWMFFLPIVALTAFGFAMAISAVIARDHKDPYRGTLYAAAVLTAGSAGACVALLAMNLGYAAPTGPAFLGSLALAPVYALLPLAVVGIRVRHRTSIGRGVAADITETLPPDPDELIDERGLLRTTVQGKAQ